ncbi:sugar ABC transporter permease [Microbacterium panaciterrae]|uniref:Sugar ABC transporter permease n=1 Tax=Microbacterium panaciterrae TaxID=985759 RepID=A0ABP8P3B9_9MICO
MAASSSIVATVPGRVTRDGAGRRRRRLVTDIRSLGYVAPTWLFMIVMGLIPIGYAVWMSLTDQSLTTATPGAWVGFTNYVRAVFTSQFAGSLLVTLIFVVFGLTIQFTLGYLLAVVLHRQLRGYQIFRTVLLIPMLLTPVVVGLVWQFIFQPDLGVIATLLEPFGMKLNVFASTPLARGMIIFIDCWMHIPFVMLMLVAGMTGVSQEPLEAAAVDGASWWQTTRYVMMPMLRPVITIALLVRCVDIVRLFDTVFTTTQGGPGTSTATVSMLAYQSTFAYFQFGSGAALSIAIAVIMIPIYFFYVRLTKI